MNYTPAIKLTTHPEYRKYLDGIGGPYIKNIEISPSGVCKAGCSFCFYKNKQSGEMLDVDKVIALITDLKLDTPCKAITWSGGGEPGAHPGLNEMIRYANDLKFTQGLFTNGLYENPIDYEKLSWVRFTWTKGLFFDRVKDCCSRTKTGMVYNYSGDDKEMCKAIDFGLSCGINYLDVRPAMPRSGEILEPVVINIPDYFLTTGKVKVQNYKIEESSKNRSYTQCRGYHFVPFLKETGELYACNYIHDERYLLGNIYENGIRDILDNAPASLKVSSDCQVCCKNHEINTLLDYALKIEDKDFV